MRVPILTYPPLAIRGVAYDDNPLVAFASDLHAVTDAGFRVRPLREIVDAWLAQDDDALHDVVGLCLEDGSDFDARDLEHPTAGLQRSALHAMQDFRRDAPGAQPGLHATSFVVASPEARSALDRACMVGAGWWSDTWWDEALGSGLMHIANHSWDHNHEALPEGLSPAPRRGTFHAIDRKDLADHEIAQSARYLHGRADNPGLGLFAYPYGEASSYVANAYLPRKGEALGLVAAFTDRFGYLEDSSDRWRLPRLVWGRDWRSVSDLQALLREARHDRRPPPPATPRIVDAEDRSRYERLPLILADWMKDHGGLGGKEILDFGCGQGVTALALAREHGARRVVGIDIGPDVERAASFAREQLGLARLPDNARFLRVTPEAPHDPEDRFDLVYSWSVFEHVDQRYIRTALENIRRMLKPGGLFFVQIAPLFHSARGAHLYSIDDEPWAHLTMQQDLLRARVFERAGDDAVAREIWGVYETLNRLTADELLGHLRACGFEILRELRTQDGPKPPKALAAIYHEDVLRTDQVVALARPRP